MVDLSVAWSEHDSAAMSAGLSVDEKVEKSGRPMVEPRELLMVALWAGPLVSGLVVMRVASLVDYSAARSVGLSVDEKVEKLGRPMVELKELQRAVWKADSKV